MEKQDLTLDFDSLPMLDLSWADDPEKKPLLLKLLRDALFDIGFLYVVNHGVPHDAIAQLESKLPILFDMPDEEKRRLGKLNSPHFLGYSGFAEETTSGKQDLREQFDFATELPVVNQNSPNSINGDPTGKKGREGHFVQLYWNLRGPNQWPSEQLVPGFKEAFLEYHDQVQALSCRFVHLVEEAFWIPVGTFDDFFECQQTADVANDKSDRQRLTPQHRIKLVKYPAGVSPYRGQGVGAHKDSSGWLTFLYQVGKEEGLEVINNAGEWIPVPPIENSFVVNFGNAFEAATEGAVKATIHRVKAPSSASSARYSIPFFQGLPLDMKVSEVQEYIPEQVKALRKGKDDLDDREAIATFLDPRWDSLGESQLRKWIRSHKDVGQKWYSQAAVDYYTA